MKRIISKILKEEFNNRISREDYLNKIVEYLVDDTIINFNENKIRLPFLPSRLTPNLSSIFPTTILTPLFPLFSVRVHHMFSEYCRDTYGLTDDDIKYVWKEYRNIILDKINNKESINESTGKISREEYLNKIVNYLVEDTIVDFKKNEIRYPFLSSSTPLLIPPFFPFPFFSSLFSEYCIDNYGLTENEIDYVWNEYKNIILDKINNMGNINESVDKISRVDYLNKIVEYLVDDTIINFNENTIRLPFTLSPFLLLHHHPSFFSSLISTSLFSKYCKDNYGLTDEEIDYVWKEYRNIIFDKINNMGSINESIDRRDEYLNKIVNYLVEDTIIDFKENKIRYPFHSLSFFPLSSPSLLSSIPLPPSFRNYNKDNYGLTENDMGYVWKEYKNIILYKINEWKNRVSKGF